MQINSATLNALRVGFKTSFQGGLDQAESQYLRIATEVPSTAKSETYGWMGKLPRIREWLGDRVVQNIMEHDYTIKNKPFEMTIGVDRDDIDDDTIGIYAPLFQDMGMETKTFPDTQCFPLLKNGFTSLCYDGQNFFDTDHVVLDEKGNETTVANTDGGAGTPWFLLCTKRALKPVIYQKRKSFEFVAKDSPTDENVFKRKEFQYGVDGRSNVGFGFWQFAWGSKQTLNAANYEIARTAIMEMKGDYGKPLGLVPDLLVVPPSLDGAAREILKSVLVNGGESNKWAGTADILVSSWLS